MNRFTLRERYIEGWYEMDEQKLISACADSFIFDDPYEAMPVTRDRLID